VERLVARGDSFVGTRATGAGELPDGVCV